MRELRSAIFTSQMQPQDSISIMAESEDESTYIPRIQHVFQKLAWISAASSSR